MKIAVIGAKGIPAKQGGIEHHCEELYSRIVKHGHEVHLFARCSYTGSFLLHQYDVQGVRVVSLPSLNLKGVDALLSSLLGAVACGGTRYDIVHFHAIGPALFSWLPRIASCARVVVTCHGLDWQRSKWNKASSRLLRLGESAAVRCADGLIVVSEELRSYFIQTYGREAVYIPNAPSNLSESDPNFAYGTSLGLKQGRYILFIGRLVPEKGLELLIKAFQTLQPDGWKLVLVGGSSDTAVFTKKLVEMAANSTEVVFTGELYGAYLAEILRGAGLFVLPSEMEGLPLSMLEAMQECVPVLASDIPVHQQLTAGERGVPSEWSQRPSGSQSPTAGNPPADASSPEEGFPRRHARLSHRAGVPPVEATGVGLGARGILFQFGDVDSCVRSLDWAIHHPQELAKMARNAQRYVEDNYDWDDITTATLRLYTTLCSLSNKSDAPLQLSNRPAEAFGSINYAEVKPLGTYLVEAGLLTQEKVDVALAEQEVTGMRLGEILVQRGWIKEQTIEYLMKTVILPERAIAKRQPIFHLNGKQSFESNKIEAAGS